MANFPKPFEIECDALSSSLVVVLMQLGRPISFFSKALAYQLAKLAYEHEFMALVLAIYYW